MTHDERTGVTVLEYTDLARFTALRMPLAAVARHIISQAEKAMQQQRETIAKIVPKNQEIQPVTAEVIGDTIKVTVPYYLAFSASLTVKLLSESLQSEFYAPVEQRSQSTSVET